MGKQTYSIKVSIWSEPNQMGNMSVYYFSRFDGCGVPLFGGVARGVKCEWENYADAEKCLKNIEKHFERKISLISYKIEIVTN